MTDARHPRAACRLRALLEHSLHFYLWLTVNTVPCRFLYVSGVLTRVVCFHSKTVQLLESPVEEGEHADKLGCCFLEPECLWVASTACPPSLCPRGSYLRHQHHSLCESVFCGQLVILKVRLSGSCSLSENQILPTKVITTKKKKGGPPNT